MVAVGARVLARHPLALTMDPARSDEQLHGLIQDVESGDVRSLAFVVPSGPTWLLPAYELALMTARRAHDARPRVRIRLVPARAAALQEAQHAVAGVAGAEGVEARLGRVCDGLLDLATDADLLVVGLHRCSPLGRLLRGSTTEELLRELPCPLLAVPED